MVVVGELRVFWVFASGFTPLGFHVVGLRTLRL